MVKPTFLCIGVQKAGTTSLIEYLSLSSDIYIHKREVHFFDKPKNDKITVNDIKNYENLFQTDKLIVGEKTPSYNYLQFAIDRIYYYNPNMKLILILREPISRAFSQYNMDLMIQKKDLSHVTDQDICSFFEKEKHKKLSEIDKNVITYETSGNYIIRGFYDEIITYILEKFHKDNLYIAVSEEIIQNKHEEYNKIIQFLGSKKVVTINENLDKHIRQYKKTIPKKLEKELYEIYKPHNEKLYELLGRKIDIWEEYYKTHDLV
jgi:hypothetical protein